MNFYLANQKPVFLSNLQNSMKDTCTHLDLIDIAKILGVDSEIYRVEWDKNETLNKIDLYISFPHSSIKTKSDLDARKKNFKQKIFVNL